MFCDDCGKRIPDDAILCPYCGVSTGENQQHQVTAYVDIAEHLDTLSDALNAPSSNQDVMSKANAGNTHQEDFSHFGGPKPSTSYSQGYGPVPSHAPVPPLVLPAQPVSYTRRPMNYQAPLSYAVPVVPVSGVDRHMKSDNATVIEIVLSLFGIFGVGWLLGGETTTGVILLICSFVIYWPLLFLGTIFTFGLGLLCLGPLAIVAIILNGILCHTMLKRREMRLLPLQQPQFVPVSPVVPPMQQRRVQQ